MALQRIGISYAFITEVSYWYGSKEPFMIGGMKQLKALLPQMKTVCFGDYGHGEVMLLHPEQYVNTLMDERNP